MSSQDYASIPSSGKLKLKGVKDGKIDKKKKKKSRSTTDSPADPDDTFKDNSVILKKLEDEDAKIKKDDHRHTELVDGKIVEPGAGVQNDEKETRGLKTEAERRYDEQRRKRLEDRLKKEGVKTHKQRVEELNRYLSGLSEHHDMPKIGPG